MRRPERRLITGVDASERPIDQVGADLLLQVVVAPIKQMLENQHANHDFGGRAETATTATLRPPTFEPLRQHLGHGLVLEQRVDLA